MKQIIFILLFFLPTLAYSQEPISFTEVVDVAGVDKKELFVRGREWFNENFKSLNDVLQINDKETGELVGKGYFVVSCVYTMMGKRVVPAGVYFQVSIWVKDGKYKYEFTNFNVPGSHDMTTLMINLGYITSSDETDKKFPNVPKKRMNESYLSVKNSTISKCNLLIESLKLKMSNKAKSTEW